MASKHDLEYSLALVSDLPIAFDPIRWLPMLWGLVRSLPKLLRRKPPAGMYEILEYDSTLELLDPQGKLAVFKRHQRVRFLQDNIIAFQDHAWGEGKPFTSYKVSPGVVVDRYRDGDRWNILISLRETKSRGDIEDFYIERTVTNGFTKREEWRQVEIRHPTRRLGLEIVFPRQRRCQRATVHQRSRNRTTILGSRHFSDLPDGRQVLSWETGNVRQFDIYTIKWRW